MTIDQLYINGLFRFSGLWLGGSVRGSRNKINTLLIISAHHVTSLPSNLISRRGKSQMLDSILRSRM